MNKVLVSLSVPYLEQQFDILMPENKKIGNIKIEIVKYINEQYPNLLINDNVNFFDRTSGEIINNDRFVKNYLKNGCSLVLM